MLIPHYPQGAVSSGETVDYRIELASGTVYTYTGNWRFSDVAGDMTSKFSSSGGSKFSNDDAAWGGASGTGRCPN
jgi:hypothetical protein